MFNTTDKYKDYIKRNNRHYEIELTIKTKKGTVYHLNKDDIVKGSFNILWQCSGNVEVEIGSVYMQELNVSILSNVDRYTLYEAEISPYFILDMNGEKESVPLGKFIVQDANRKVAFIELIAYDNMIHFDKDFNQITTIGTAYDYLKAASEACGVELEQSQIDIEKLPNAKEVVSIYEDNDISSWRDLLHYVSQLLGSFATINRYGQLRIATYSSDVTCQFERKHRFSSSYSDFTTCYTAISSTNQRTNTAEYISLENDDGLTMNLGTNPLIQYGLEETRKKILTNILNTISVINYIPFEATILCDPSLECGDVIQFIGGHADDNGLYCITSINFDYGKDFTISGSGKNPKLIDGKSKSDKNIAGLIEKSSENQLISYSYTNAKKMDISNILYEIIAIHFVTKKRTSVEFKATILYSLEVETSTNVKFIYEIDSDKINTHVPIETKSKGHHITSLFYPLSEIKEQSEHTIKVFMLIEDGIATIDRFGIMANVNGQGLVSDVVPWDGKIELEDEFESITIKNVLNTVQFDFIDNGPIFKHGEVMRYAIEDTFETLMIEGSGQVMIKEFHDSTTIGNEVVSATLSTEYKENLVYSSFYVDDTELFKVREDYIGNATVETVDTGRLMSFSIDSTLFEEITGILLEVKDEL